MTLGISNFQAAAAPLSPTGAATTVRTQVSPYESPKAATDYKIAKNFVHIIPFERNETRIATGTVALTTRQITQESLKSENLVDLYDKVNNIGHFVILRDDGVPSRSDTLYVPPDVLKKMTPNSPSQQGRRLDNPEAKEANAKNENTINWVEDHNAGVVRAAVRYIHQDNPHTINSDLHPSCKIEPLFEDDEEEIKSMMDQIIAQKTQASLQAAAALKASSAASPKEAPKANEGGAKENTEQCCTIQ